ncbi:prepilin-type N-terminal cleavage/methylation domain-containing protein [Glaciecola siphonariae]|uniref:Prepilin-type N-terminal cleavage/methylation domain-containing protein n=1 Tax=Glaciecola siphonariae TaxID=521012 RepID=A0ABV9LXH7_9ALTE
MQQKGFTLIELIIVIVILGILAVTAAPRFIDIQTDARKQTIVGVEAALKGAAKLVFAKAVVNGVHTLPNSDSRSEVEVAGVPVQTHLGYPDVNGYTQIQSDLSATPPVYGIDSFIDIDSTQLTVSIDASNSQMRITFAGEDPLTNDCSVTYFNANASNTSEPLIFTRLTGC